MGDKTRVLIVDRDQSFVNHVTTLLKDKYDFITAAAAGEGLDLARSHHPDVVVLGYLAPRGTSFALHNQLRSDPTTRDIPLVVVDVRPQDHARKGWRTHEGLRMEAEDYLSKPVAPAELATILEKTIRRTSGEPMSLKEASEHMEEALERINRIEQLLVG